MADFRAINDTKGVALTGAPHSQAVVYDKTIYCGGQLPMNSKGELISGTIGEKTRQCLSNLSAVLQNAGSDLSLVLKVMIFLEDISDFSAMNEEYSKWFTGDQRPARSCVAVKQLPRGSPVEIECIARIKPDKSLL